MNCVFKELDPLHMLVDGPLTRSELNWLSLKVGMTAIASLRKAGVDVNALTAVLRDPLDLSDDVKTAEMLSLALANSIFIAYVRQPSGVAHEDGVEILPETVTDDETF